MTEPVQPPTSTDQAAPTPEPPIDETTRDQNGGIEPGVETDEPTTGQRAAREAAKYRTQLRETEAERDTLRTELDTYRTREVVRIAKDSGLIEPEDLLKHVALDDLLDAGAVAPELVQTAIVGLRESRPQWFDDYVENTRPPTNRPIEGLRAGATPRGYMPETTTWGSFLTDAAKKKSRMQ